MNINEMLLRLKDIKPLTGHKLTLKELINKISDNTRITMLKETSYNLVPLLIRAWVDKAVDMNKEEELNEAYKFAKLVFELFESDLKGNYFNSKKKTNELRQTSFYKQHENDVIEEQKDTISEYWSDTSMVIDLVKHVIKYFKDKKLVILNFAHGSTRAALFLGFLLKNFYGFKIFNLPVRFSIHKLKDKEFKFPVKDSIRLLEKKVKEGYKILLLDEDVSSGETFLKADEYLKKPLFKNILQAP